jgi:hypothetical protein
LLVWSRVAAADEADDLAARGEELAKQGEWSRAIDAFKAADEKRPRAKHACLIGLAYTRRELWGEAELFLAICKQRADASDPAPDWLADAERTLGEKLSAASAAPVAITVEPATAAALISVSSFAPGETFAPRTIHLAPGNHVLRATAPGYYPATREITVAAGAPQSVVVQLHHLPPPPTPFRRRVGYVVMAAGAAIALGGLAYDQYDLQPYRQPTTTNATYDAQLDTFHTRRDMTFAFWIGGALVIAGGVVLHVTRPSEAVHVAASIDSRGAMLGLAWQR